MKKNPHLKHLVTELRKASCSQEAGLWKRLANELEKPTRVGRVVNLSRLNRCTTAKEIIVVPGKVLGSGELNHELTIAAWNFSSTAKENITKAKGKCLTIAELIKKAPKGKNVRIIG
jgi:large subunit ribosomal protein L18e